MIGKAFLFVTCAFGVFLQIQSSPVAKSEETEFKPDVRYVQVEVDDKEFNLTLVQRLRQVFFEKTPVWTISSVEGEQNYEITEVPYEKAQINGIYYGDDDLMATVLATYDEEEHEIYYNGVINVGTTIYKVESAVDEWWRDSVETVDQSEEDQSSESDEKHSEQESEEIIGAQNFKLRSSYISSKDDAELLENSLTTLHPKILAVVDYDLYKELGYSVDKVTEYVATFWDAVDLKYTKLNTPKVKITVTGVLVAKDENVLANEELNSFNENFAKKIDFVNYDAAFIMSKSSVKARQGQATLGSICNRQNSVAFVQDNASYEGLLSATHELGHLLNLPHDGMDRAEKCTVDTDSTTFMATGVESEKQLTWSKCSQDIINEFSKSKAAACLENPWRYE